MIIIKTVSCNGQPLTQAVQAEFDEMGGTIGRADGNALVLPDSERHISRTHATIAFRAGGYVIRDLSSTLPVHVNGQPLGSGCEARLAGGDERAHHPRRAGAHVLGGGGMAPTARPAGHGCLSALFFRWSVHGWAAQTYDNDNSGGGRNSGARRPGCAAVADMPDRKRWGDR
jgi:hypothetical protein